MMARADRVMLGQIDWGHVKAVHTDEDGSTVLTARHWWQREPDRERAPGEKRPGSRLIGTGAVLLVLLGAGLLAVSYMAQYHYVLGQRHEHIASLIEAGALDIGLIIFSLIAIGLALAGLGSKTERAAIMLCAVASAVMNFAPADASSWRSVLAWTMPPVFLAFVVDRVVSAIRRHVLGMRDSRSPWSMISDVARRIARSMALSVLYVLRFLVDRRGTCAGLKRAILNATPLPEAAAPAAVAAPPSRPKATSVRRETPSGSWGGLTKTDRLVIKVKQRHGNNIAAIPRDQLSRIATELAPEIGMHPASARSALLAVYREALPAGEGDAK